MTEMKGLPDKVEFSAIPTHYFNIIMPQVDSIGELKLSLIMFRMLYKKRGSPQLVSFDEIAADAAVIKIFGTGKQASLQLKQLLNQSVDRGIFIGIKVPSDDTVEPFYMVNNPSNNQAMLRIKLHAQERPFKHPVSDIIEPLKEMPDIFTYYEENIGMLTPLIADEIKLAEKTYPQNWIIEAIGEAAVNNKRSWRYILRILERWLREGKTDGTYKQDNSTEDPDKYTRGKYQRFVQH